MDIIERLEQYLSAPEICADCVYCESPDSGTSDCTHPKAFKGTNPVTGKPNYESCLMMRSIFQYYKCGPKAKLFELSLRGQKRRRKDEQ